MLGEGGVFCGDQLTWEAFRHVGGHNNVHTPCKKFGVQENENVDLADPEKT